MDALEQSACQPELANLLAKSLHRILQLGGEQTVVSFRSLDFVSRLLKVACIQAQEFKRSRNDNLSGENGSSSCELDPNWLKCMGTCLDLFNEYLSLQTMQKFQFCITQHVLIACLFCSGKKG